MPSTALVQAQAHEAGPRPVNIRAHLRLSVFLLLALVGFAGACGTLDGPSPEATARADAVRSATPPARPQPELSPTATAVAAQTATRLPTAQAAATPTASPLAQPQPELSPTGTVAAPAATPFPTSFPTPTPTPRLPEATPAPDGGPLYGGTLNLVARHDISHQDVHRDVSPALAAWGPGIVYSRLMRFRSGPEVELPSLAVECELCESYETQDGKTYLFHIRRGVRWHDIPPVNGRELTADDLVFSYRRQLQDGFPNAALLSGIRTMEALDPYTLSIELASPDADFLVALADAHSKIVAREAVELSGDLFAGPTIGTGPWVLAGSRPGVSHTFTANPSYFESGLPLVDSLTIRVIEDGPTQDAAFRVNNVDVHQLEPDEWEALRQRRPDMPFALVKESGVGLEVALKTTEPPFDDVLVRRAVLAAVDPWQAIEDIWGGAAYVSAGFPVAAADWLLGEEELATIFGRPDLAQDLLKQAGVDLPVPVTITVGDFGDEYVAHAERMAEEMAAVGFEARVELVNRRAFGEDVWLGGNYQMMVGPPAPAVTPNNYLASVLHSQGRWNTTEHRDQELDGLIVAQASELDPSTRRTLVQEIQRRMLTNAYRFMPATRISIWSWWPRVQDFYPNFAGSEYSHWSRVWLSE